MSPDSIAVRIDRARQDARDADEAPRVMALDRLERCHSGRRAPSGELYYRTITPGPDRLSEWDRDAPHPRLVGVPAWRYGCRFNQPPQKRPPAWLTPAERP